MKEVMAVSKTLQTFSTFGYVAYFEGAKPANNPHKPGTADHVDWQADLLRGQADSIRESERKALDAKGRRAAPSKLTDIFVERATLTSRLYHALAHFAPRAQFMIVTSHLDISTLAKLVEQQEGKL